MVVRSLVTLAAACLIGACSFGALDGFSGGEDGADAASGTDSGPGGSDAQGGSDGATPNDSSTGSDTGGGDDPLAFNDTFEGASCAPWTASRTNAVTEAPGHEGNMSCRACTTDTTGGGIRRQFRPKAPATTLPAGEYLITVWIKDPTYAGSIAFELYELTPTFQKGNYVSGQPTALTSGWKPITIQYFAPAPVPGFQIDLYVDNGPPMNTCFSADDATLVYTK